LAKSSKSPFHNKGYEKIFPAPDQYSQCGTKCFVKKKEKEKKTGFFKQIFSVKMFVSLFPTL